MRRLSICVMLATAAACGGSDGDPNVGPVPEYPQRTGDATVGWHALIEKGYVGCGVPLSAYNQVSGPAPDSLRLPDRGGLNATMPYNLTAFTTTSGIDVVTPNCLQCHAESLRGQLVIGLGSHTMDYTLDLANYANFAGALVNDPAERVEWQKWRDRMVAVGPYTIMRTVGVNPADNLAAILFAHRDPETLAWSDTPLLPLPPQTVVPVDVPPWWRMQKKHAMFYDGAGRGDHARIMMTASTLCVDSRSEAEAIDAYFPDVRSFILSLQPPRWPFAIDQAKADAGHAVFGDHCARCHGDGADYPNLVVGLDDVGTDATLATGAAQFADVYVDWFNRSFFGEAAFLAPAKGYVAPPLDGIWATAPFLHNGSVPTLAALLDSPTRPKFFIPSLDTNDYDEANLGWHFQTLTTGQDAEPDGNRRVRIYDTTQLGYGNGGHTFGDALTADQRGQLLEFLKTL